MLFSRTELRRKSNKKKGGAGIRQMQEAKKTTEKDFSQWDRRRADIEIA